MEWPCPLLPSALVIPQTLHCQSVIPWGTVVKWMSMSLHKSLSTSWLAHSLDQTALQQVASATLCGQNCPQSQPRPRLCSPVFHAAVSADGLLHVGVALRNKPGPRHLPDLGLGSALRVVVPVVSLAAPPSPSTPTATTWWRGVAEATQPVLTAALKVVFGTGE